MTNEKNVKTKLTKQEYRILLDAYIRDFELGSPQHYNDERHKTFFEIRDKLIKLGVGA